MLVIASGARCGHARPRCCYEQPRTSRKPQLSQVRPSAARAPSSASSFSPSHSCSPMSARDPMPPSGSQENTHAPFPELDVDPIWMSSRTARQIYALREVEKVRHAHSLSLRPGGARCAAC